MAEPATRHAVARRVVKAPGAFRTISEVAAELDVPQHVLRFWESKFSQIRPLKRGGGRRYYRPEDVDLLRGIRHLLYSDGYTIKGVQKLLREQGVRTVVESGKRLAGEAAENGRENGDREDGPGAAGGAGAAALDPERRRRLTAVLGELMALRKLLGHGTP